MREKFLNGFIIAVILGCTGIVRADLNTGLIAYYPFDGNVKDMSGNDYDGTVYGASLIEDRFGNSNKAYNFDGNDKIIVDSLKNFYWGTNLSVSVWFKRTGQWENYQGIVNNGYLDHGSWEIRIAANDNGTILGGGVVTVENPRTWDVWGLYASQNEWHHAVLIYNGSNLSFYLDGEAQAINPHSNNNAPPDIGGIITKNNPLTIGQAGYGKNNEYFFGSIDDVRIYNRALSETETQELYNEGSAPNEEEPETPVATLSESFSIHIPELDYKIHHGETSKLDIYLSPAPSIEDRLTWKLESFSNVVCSSTGNNCSNNFQAAIASSDEVDAYAPLDIHIPKITYSGTQYWANLEFFGISDGNFVWQLGQYGVPNISSFPTTCNFPYAHMTGFQKSIHNPTCEQKWNLWNYHQLGSTLLRNDFNVLYAKFEGILDRRAYNAKITEIAQRTIEVVSFAGSITSSATGAAGELIGGSVEEIAGGLIPIVSNNLTRYISDDSGYLSAVFEVRGIVSDAIIAIGSTGGNPVIATLSISPNAMDKIMTAIAAYRTGELVEKLNEINIASEYLALYYSFGSDAEETSYKYTGNRSSSFENIIIAVADELKLKNRWYGDDYNYDQVVEIINHYKNNVIPDITRIVTSN